MKWSYPSFVYSKDRYLLETPFPTIAGISQDLFKAMNKAGYDFSGMYIYHLDENKPKYNPVMFKDIKFIQNKQVIEKIDSAHTRIFVKGKSSLSKLSFNPLTNSMASSYSRSNTTSSFQNQIETEDKMEDISSKDILHYFGLYRGLIQTMFVNPINSLEVSIFTKIINKI